MKTSEIIGRSYWPDGAAGAADAPPLPSAGAGPPAPSAGAGVSPAGVGASAGAGDAPDGSG